MYLILSVLLLLGRSSLAAKWGVDGSCDLVGIGNPGEGLSPFLMATDEIKKAMTEGITIAENAFNVMKDNTGDKHVADMLKLILGEGADYQSKFDAVKKTLENVAGYEKEHAADRPMDQGWQESMTSNDVMIFCSNGRMKQKGLPDVKLWSDESMKDTKYLTMELEPGNLRSKCYAVDYDLGNIGTRTIAFTTASDFFNKGQWFKDGRPKDKSPYLKGRPDIAFSIDVCAWFLHRSLNLGWPRIDKDRITQTQQPGFKGGVSDFATPVDGLRNTGLAMLHELTHTHQGGRLIDIADENLPAGTPSCYGWKCAQDLKDPTNSDNVAMLGLALHLWTMGYYVDKDGNVNNK